MVYQTDKVIKRMMFCQKSIQLILNVLVHTLFFSVYSMVIAGKAYPYDWRVSTTILIALSFFMNCILCVFDDMNLSLCSYLISIVSILITITPERENYFVMSIPLIYVIINGTIKIGPLSLIPSVVVVSVYLVGMANSNLLLWGQIAPLTNYTSLVAAILAFIFCGIAGILHLRLKRNNDFIQYQIVHLSKSNDYLTDTNVSLQRQIVKETEKAINTERTRISREIHDTVACTLINSLSMLDTCRIASKDSDINPIILNSITESCRLLRDSFTEIRDIISKTRQEYSTGMELQDLKKLIDVFRESSHVNIYLNYGDIPSQFDYKIKELFYRSVQEGLTNAIRHGYAQSIVVSFHCLNDGIELTIKDNGIGAIGNSVQGFGLQGMKERVAELNGTLNISTSPGMGFCLRIWVPLTQ